MENCGESKTTINHHTPLGVSRIEIIASYLSSDNFAKHTSCGESSELVAFAVWLRDPYLFINDRGFHILAHCYSMAPYPSNAISGHGESASNGSLI